MTRRKQIALFGGSFNPPGLHHLDVVETLVPHFDEVVVIPCGPRPDKPTTNDIEPIHRAALADITFGGVPGVRVELFDLERGTFTRTHELEALFATEGEVWHIVGADLVARGADGLSQIRRSWAEGERLWHGSNFAVCMRGGHPLAESDLPPHHRLFPLRRSGSSAEIRSAIFEHRALTPVVTVRAAEYIERYNLYRGSAPQHRSLRRLSDARFFVVSDHSNPHAEEIASRLPRAPLGDATMIAVIGGDGTMLRAIREHWRARLPFYGLNTGHLGMLLNDQASLPAVGDELVLHHLPLLHVDAITDEGQALTGLGFNDVWVERATGQTARFAIEIDGKTRMSELVGDGLLVATAAGSSSYASAMGASPLPFDTRVLLLVGSNVFRPLRWKSAALDLASNVRLVGLDLEKRPLHGFIDGSPLGRVNELQVRISRAASVELAFRQGADPATKLAKAQFPVR